MPPFVPGIVPGTNRVCPRDKPGEIGLPLCKIRRKPGFVPGFHRICPRDKPGEIPGQTRGRPKTNRTKKFYVYVPFSSLMRVIYLHPTVQPINCIGRSRWQLGVSKLPTLWHEIKTKIFPRAPPTLALWRKKSKGNPPKKTRVFLFAEPLKSLEKDKNTRKIGKQKKEGKPRKQGLKVAIFEKPMTLDFFHLFYVLSEGRMVCTKDKQVHSRTQRFLSEIGKTRILCVFSETEIKSMVIPKIFLSWVWDDTFRK